MKLKHELRPVHNNKKNLPWFDTMFSMLHDGGILRTSAGNYVKTPTGFKPA